MKTNIPAVFLALSAALAFAPAARAQSEGATEGSIRALLIEVRHLREAVERQASATTRAQLLVTRLTLQDQRVTKAQAAVEAAADAVTSLRSEMEQYRSMSSVTNTERPTDPEAKAAIERQMKMWKERMSAEEARMPELEARLETARQALEVERGKYEALDSLLSQFDGDLGRKVS